MNLLTPFICCSFVVSFLQTGYAQHKEPLKMDPKPEQEMKMDTSTEMEEVAHPFLSHMGVPEAVGVYSLRISGLYSSMENIEEGSNGNGDFGFHFETGLTDFIGLHIRNDGFLNSQHSEVMFQFAAIRSKDKMSGFSPLIEFEFPTKSGGDRHINVLVGFTTALANSKMAFNQALHYNPREEEYEYNASFVMKIGKRIFPVVELFGEALPHEQPLLNVLAGVKVAVSKKLILGVAFQAPVTTRKDFTWQLIFQPDIEWRHMSMKNNN